MKQALASFLILFALSGCAPSPAEHNLRHLYATSTMNRIRLTDCRPLLDMIARDQRALGFNGMLVKRIELADSVGVVFVTYDHAERRDGGIIYAADVKSSRILDVWEVSWN